MTQSRRDSLVETAISLASGTVISYCLTYFVLPFGWDLHPTATDAGAITIMFTGVSFIRVYLVRRLFVRYQLRRNLWTIRDAGD